MWINSLKQVEYLFFLYLRENSCIWNFQEIRFVPICKVSGIQFVANSSVESRLFSIQISVGWPLLLSWPPDSSLTFLHHCLATLVTWFILLLVIVWRAFYVALLFAWIIISKLDCRSCRLCFCFWCFRLLGKKYVYVLLSGTLTFLVGQCFPYRLSIVKCRYCTLASISLTSYFTFQGIDECARGLF